MFGVVFQGNDNPFRCRQHNNSSGGVTSSEEASDFGSSCEFRTPVLNETIAPTNISTTGSCSNDDVEYLLPFDFSFVSEFNLICDNQFLLGVSQNALTFGTLVATVVIPYLADTYGRWPVMIFSGCLTFLSSLGVALSSSFEMMFCFKILIGFSVFGTELTALMCCIAEITVIRHRGMFLAGGGGMSWAMSCLALGLIAFSLQDFSWRVLQFAFTAFCLVVLLLLFVLDESMRWLSVNNRHEQVLKILRKASKWNGAQSKRVIEAYNEPVQTEGNDAKASDKIDNLPIENRSFKAIFSVQKEGNDATASVLNEQKRDIVTSRTENKIDSLKTIFLHPILRKHTIFNIVAWFVNALIYYALTYLSSSLPGNVYVNFTLSVLSEIPVYIFQIFFIEKVGRRKLFTIFTFIAGVTLLSLAVVMELDPNQSALLMTLTCLGKFGATGAYNQIFLYTPELYPTSVRSRGLAFAFFSGRVAALLAPYVGLVFDRVAYAPGLFFGIASIVLGFSTIVMPETSGRELAQTVADMEKW